MLGRFNWIGQISKLARISDHRVRVCITKLEDIVNQVEKTLNGRDSYQIASGVWQIFWAIAIFDGLDGGSMGWINGYLGITAPV